MKHGIQPRGMFRIGTVWNIGTDRNIDLTIMSDIQRSNERRYS